MTEVRLGYYAIYYTYICWNVDLCLFLMLMFTYMLIGIYAHMFALCYLHPR